MVPRAPRSDGPLRVLVVDDSAVVRKVMAEVLGADGTIDVTVAADPLIAKRKMDRCRPDVIVLDLEMPRMDGLTFLQEIMRTDPLPVVICSGYVGRGSDLALKALEHGAVELVTKPRIGVQEFVYESGLALRQAVHAAAGARLDRRAQLQRPPAAVTQAPTRLEGLAVQPDRIVAMGASTGGTEALHAVLSALPADGPAVLVVQHMPAGFTQAFANRLNATCPVEVREAAPGDDVRRGLVLIAPGDQHLRLRRSPRGFVVSLDHEAPVSGHRPSVDVLFHSVARAAGRRSVGVLLTGMGADGAEGLLAMKEAGASTAAQNEATSVVFGMPKEAIRRGAADAVLALPQIPAWILRAACRFSASN